MAALFKLTEAAGVVVVDLLANGLELFRKVLLLEDVARLVIHLNDLDHGLPEVEGGLLNQVCISVFKELDERVRQLPFDPHKILEYVAVDRNLSQEHLELPVVIVVVDDMKVLVLGNLVALVVVPPVKRDEVFLHFPRDVVIWFALRGAPFKNFKVRGV